MADSKTASRTVPQLGLFGKLRAVSEHFDDLGQSAPLSALKTRVYDNGIRRAIDQGTWKDLSTANQLVAFDHWFTELRGPAVAVGRAIASRDAVGRDQFPLIGAMALDRGGPAALIESVASLLDPVVNFAHASEDLESVRARLSASRGLVASPEGSAVRTIEPLLDHPSLGPDRIGLRKALRALARQAEPYRARDKTLAGRASHVRVPTCLDPLAGSAAWARLTFALVEGRAPVTTWAHHSGGWTDVLIGEYAPGDLYCLRASPDAMPMVTQVPYEFDERAIREIDAVIASLQSGAKAPAPANDSAAAPRKSLLKYFIPVGAVVLVGGAAWMAMQSSSSGPARPESVPVVASAEPAPTPQPDAVAQAESARLAEEARVVEEARRAEEARIAQEATISAEARRIEEARLAEETRLAEARKLAQEQQQAEQARITQQQLAQEVARSIDQRLAAIVDPQVRAEAQRRVDALRRDVTATSDLAEQSKVMLDRMASVDAEASQGRLRPIATEGHRLGATFDAWLADQRTRAVDSVLAGRDAIPAFDGLRAEVSSFIAGQAMLATMRDLGVMPDETFQGRTPAELCAEQVESPIARFAPDASLFEMNRWPLSVLRADLRDLDVNDEASLGTLAQLRADALTSLSNARADHAGHVQWIDQVTEKVESIAHAKAQAWLADAPMASLDPAILAPALASVGVSLDDMPMPVRSRVVLAEVDGELARATLLDAAAVESVGSRLVEAMAQVAPQREAELGEAISKLASGSSVGPSGPSAPWRLVASDESSRRYAYTRNDGTEVQIQFLPVESSGRRFFLARNELTLAQTSALIESLGSTGQGLASKLRAGPRPTGATGWQVQSAQVVAQAGQPWFWKAEYGKIEASHPIQNIPVSWAGELASASGMRLPGEAEWLAAAPNESDPTHAAVTRGRALSLLADRAGQSGQGDPAVGAFRGIQKGLASLVGGRGLSSQQAFFRPAEESGSAFDAMLGNVAEIVLRADGSFGVVGGSALAPPDTDPRRVYPVDDASRGYADVGVRLAFDDDASRQAVGEIRDLIRAALETP
jgi:hypothetical protein